MRIEVEKVKANVVEEYEVRMNAWSEFLLLFCSFLMFAITDRLSTHRGDSRHGCNRKPGAIGWGYYGR